MSLNSIVYSIGSVLNVLALCYCCKKWKALGNIKFLVAIQAVLSSLTVTANFTLASEKVDLLPEGKFLCYQLPSLVVFFLCLAICNLTCLVCVKYAQMINNWHLRRSSVMLMFLAVLGVSTLLSSPTFYSIYKGWSILRFDAWECIANGSNADAGVTTEKVDINVVRYGFWFLVLEFVVPSFIIASRLVLVLIHLWQEGSITDTSLDPHKQVAIRFIVNAIFTILFIVVTIFLSLSIDDMDSAEALDFLNLLFYKFVLFFVSVLCCPWYLMEMIPSQCTCANRDEENSCLVRIQEHTSKLNI